MTTAEERRKDYIEINERLETLESSVASMQLSIAQLLEILNTARAGANIIVYCAVFFKWVGIIACAIIAAWALYKATQNGYPPQGLPKIPD